jgi:hypothetical protein
MTGLGAFLSQIKALKACTPTFSWLLKAVKRSDK